MRDMQGLNRIQSLDLVAVERWYVGLTISDLIGRQSNGRYCNWETSS